MPPPVVGLTSPAASPTASTDRRRCAHRRRAAGSSAAGRAHDVADPVARAMRAAIPRNRSARASLAHQPDRGRTCDRRARTAPPTRIRAARSARPKWTSTSLSRARHLELGASGGRSRGDAEAELAVEAVVGAAGQHAGPRRIVAAPSLRPIATPSPSTATARTRAPDRCSAPARAARVGKRADRSAQRSTTAASTRSASIATSLPSRREEPATCVVVRMVSRGRSNSSNASRPSTPVQWTASPTRRAPRGR